MSTDTDRIRALNDQLRRHLTGGKAVMTPGVAALGTEAVQRLVQTIAIFDDFGTANDPHGEHDFGAFEFEGAPVMFKIDYYDLSSHSPDPADPAVTMRESLCTPSSSVCKHWKRARVDNATRATFPGYRRFDRLRRQVVGTDLMRCAGNNLHSRKDTGFDKAPYRMVCDA
jgi:Protein of unknown function (DUF3768)